MSIPANVVELESLLPILKEKDTAGLIRSGSYNKAQSLVSWGKNRPLTEKQNLFIGKLIRYANRKHRSVSLTTTVDTDAIIEEVLAKIGDKKSDTGAVVAALLPRVMEEVKKQLPPREVIVTVQHTDGKKHKAKGPTHHKFETLMKVATTRLSTGYVPGIFLQGEASSGKTTGARQVAEALKLDWHFNGAISFPHEMLGFIDGAGKYHRTPFREAYEHGGVYTFDEVDRSDPVALLAVNPHLANGVATFPDKQIKRHKDCIIICTANTWGLGADANYSGATKLDAAFLSRFPVRIGWDIDPALEDQIVSNEKWLRQVRHARVRAREVGLKVMIDTRIAQAGAALIEAGFTIDEAAAATYLANLKPEQRNQLS